MIKSLDDVEQYARAQAAAVPSIAREVELRGPGLTELEVALLHRALPGLPDEYLTIATRWNLQWVSIGYFDLRPPMLADSRRLVDGLILSNGPDNPMFELMRSDRLVAVAGWGADPVLLASKQTAQKGKVFMYVLTDQPDLYPRFLANDFGDLLMAATELHAFSMSERQEPDRLIAAIDGYIPADALDEWRILASEVMG